LIGRPAQTIYAPSAARPRPSIRQSH